MLKLKIDFTAVNELPSQTDVVFRDDVTVTGWGGHRVGEDISIRRQDPDTGAMSEPVTERADHNGVVPFSDIANVRTLIANVKESATVPATIALNLRMSALAHDFLENSGLMPLFAAYIGASIRENASVGAQPQFTMIPGGKSRSH